MERVTDESVRVVGADEKAKNEWLDDKWKSVTSIDWRWKVVMRRMNGEREIPIDLIERPFILALPDSTTTNEK